VLVMAFAACGKKAGFPVAGSAKAEDLLTLMPKSVQGVVIIDIHRGMNIPFVDKMLKKEENAAKYKENIDKFGLDPQKDIYFAAIGFSQTTDAEGKSVPQGAGVINLKYDQARILESAKKENPEFKQDVYEGVTLFTVPEKEKAGKEMYGAFLDASNVALGTESGVKAVIDVFKGKAESALKNDELMKLVKNANSSALVWNVTSFTPEQMKKMAEGSPMLESLKSLQALTMYVDDKNNGLQVEIKALSPDAAKNKEIADMLTGFKAMGSMGSAEKPEIGELMKSIEISSGPDNVKIYVSVSAELLDKLGQEAEKQVKSKLEQMKPAETPAETEPIK
ncbi:MAG: hypothetical protein ACYDH3_09250, partial [Candidatus Aminicenantales bacterium]